MTTIQTILKDYEKQQNNFYCYENFPEYCKCNIKLAKKYIAEENLSKKEKKEYSKYIELLEYLMY